ncbi:MAG: hypothetical protein HKN16_00085 [Saprospiraceae bacterium]|nr:hypothetical protein [Saprospiraceae bacterium]
MGITRLTLAFAFLFFCGNSYAQSYEPSWGPPSKKPGGFNTPMYSLGVMNGDYYMSFVNGATNTIQRFNSKHKFLGKQELTIQKGKRNLAIREILHTRDGYYGFSGYYDKKKQTYSLIAYDLEDGKFTKRRKIFSQELRLSGLRSASGGKLSLFGGRVASQLGIPLNDFVMSADSNMLAFHNLVSDRNYFAEDQIMVGLFDKDLNLQWKKKQPLNYQDRDLVIVRAAVSVKGEIFILGRLFERRRVKDRRLPRYDYKLFVITKDDFKEINIRLPGDNAPTDAGLFIPPSESEVIVGGLYTNSDRRGGLLGTFLIRIDLADYQIGSKQYKFSPRDLENIVNKGRIKRNKGLQEDRYEIKDFISFTNGSMAMVMESTWTTINSNPSPSGANTIQTIYHSDAILIPTFGRDGELEKIGKIDKYYSSSSALNQSYGLGWDQGNIFLLYNDRKSGRERRDIGGRKGSLYTDMTVLSADGKKIWEGNVFNNRAIRSVFVPSMCTIREGKMMLVGLRLGKYQVGIVDVH